MTSPTPLVRAAEALAREAHAGQFRKPDATVPYFTHLDSVAARLRGFGVADDVTLAAAYLHDLLEDQSAFAPRLRAEFPAEVVAVVEVLTEAKTDASGAKRPKKVRFADYVAALARDTPAARVARVVSCADKIDNARSLVAAERAGKNLLATLSTRPGQHAGQLAALRAVYAPAVPAAMLADYDAAARELEAYVRAWVPGHAIAIAAGAHRGQFDRAGAPYVLHPLRLMMRARTDDERMAAVLHDVVEDCGWTFEGLRDEGIPERVVAALACLTKRDDEAGDDGYERFIARVVTDPLAAQVKLWDLEDNMDTTRLGDLGPRDLARIERYHTARKRVLAALGG